MAVLRSASTARPPTQAAPGDTASRPAVAGGSAAERLRRRLAGLLGNRWALPLLLVVAFLAVFGVVLGDRLVPALTVRVEPVVLVRAGDASGPADEASADAAPPAGESVSAAAPADAGSPPSPPAAGALLFQASGWVEPDPLPIKATALVSGVIDEVHVLEGQSVQRGDLLATLIDEDAALDLREAERRIDLIRARCDSHLALIPVAEARLDVARREEAVEHARVAEQQDLVDRLVRVSEGTVPERQIREAEHALAARIAMAEAAAAQVRREQAELAQLVTLEQTFAEEIREAEVEVDRRRLAFERTRIHSPVDGVVLRLLAVPGAKRMLDMDDADSSTIAILYQPERLQVRVDVPLAEAGRLAVGQPTRITCDLLPDATFAGVVTRIVGEADLQRNTLQAKVRIVDPDRRLRPEMLSRVKFFEPDPGTSAEPSAAPGAIAGRHLLFASEGGVIDREGNEAGVWVVGSDSRAQRRRVVLGAGRRDGHVEILDGLRPGDSVILEPLDRLEDGRRVRLATDSMND